MLLFLLRNFKKVKQKKLYYESFGDEDLRSPEKAFSLEKRTIILDW